MKRAIVILGLLAMTAILPSCQKEKDKECPQCATINTADAKNCYVCGYEF